MDVAEETKFRELSFPERLEIIRKSASLKDSDLQLIKDSVRGLGFDNVNRMIENAIGVFPVPMGIATNFLINDLDYLIPMVTEEPSVVAATSKAAKIARLTGGFHAEADDSLMIGQIQVIPHGKQHETISRAILKEKDELFRIASSRARSSKVVEIRFRAVQDESQLDMGKMIIVELVVNTHDAMGA